MSVLEVGVAAAEEVGVAVWGVGRSSVAPPTPVATPVFPPLLVVGND